MLDRLKRVGRRVLGSKEPATGHPGFLADNPRFSHYDIGQFTYGEPYVFWHKPGRKLVIGRYCSIAAGVSILLGGNHSVNAISTFPFKELLGSTERSIDQEFTKGDVKIGNDVWIGKQAMILSGVTIGDGAVVGARAVVTKDVKPYSIVAGNPARHVRYRVEESLIPNLIALGWWNWPVEKIKEIQHELLSVDVRGFIDRHK